MVKRKGTRRGFAGDDVTETEQFQDDVVAERDESFVVEDTDSDHTIETESTVITDDHEVVTSTEVGSEEDFVAESEKGDADTINEDGRQGRRKGLRRRGSRRGGDEEDHVEDLEEELEDVEEEIEDVEESEDEEREGHRRGLRRRGSRLGESVIMDEDGTTEEVDLPEPDEREGRRRGSRKGRIINTAEHGSYDVSDIDEYVAQGNIVNPTQIKNYLVNEKGYSELKAWATYDVWDEDRFGSRNGSRKGTRMGAYGGKSPEHQPSIRAAVSVAMSDRRL